MGGEKNIKHLIPGALDMYNLYLNNRPIKDFFKMTKTCFTSKKENRWLCFFFPAMMIVPGIEEEYIAFMKQKEQDAIRKNKNSPKY